MPASFPRSRSRTRAPRGLDARLDERRCGAWNRWRRAASATGRASRQKLWRKGESSGHTQRLVELRFDCDSDALLLLVEQTGPACHTNRPVCFNNAVQGDEIRVIAEPVE